MKLYPKYYAGSPGIKVNTVFQDYEGQVFRTVVGKCKSCVGVSEETCRALPQCDDEIIFLPVNHLIPRIKR